MIKAEELANLIIDVLKKEEALAFVDIAEKLKAIIGEAYNEKQLRNCLYNMVKKATLSKDEEKKYCYIVCNAEEPISENINVLKKVYKQKISEICKETEKMLKNPFDKFEGNELIEAAKLHDLNKRIKKMLEES